MRTTLIALLVCLAAAGASEAPHAQTPAPLTVSAASSLADVMADVGRAWQATGAPGILVNAGGSNVLARQIAEGARADVFMSADTAQMEVAAASGRLVDGSIVNLLSNTLVVIVPGESAVPVREPKDLTAAAVRRVALGNPDSVPAGVYARQWLERLGLWDAVRLKVVPMSTVRAALAAVRAGRAEAGVVFSTDARTAPDVRVAYAVPVADAPPIRYPVAVVRGQREAEAARFVAFLQSPEARTIFEAAGFLVGER